MQKVHNSVDFYIDGEFIEIRPLHSSEPFAKNSIEELLKQGFVSIGEFKTQPNVPLKTMCDEENTNSGTVFVAITEKDNFKVPVGVALYSFSEASQAHEMGTLISSKYQHTRLSYELNCQMIEDAKSNGVKTIYTTDSTEDIEMRNVAKKLNMSVRLDKKYRTVRYSLQTDLHPWIVEV